MIAWVAPARRYLRQRVDDESFESPVARLKNLTNTETALTSQVDALGAQIVADNPGYLSEELSVDDVRDRVIHFITEGESRAGRRF